jgi:hypothetical protein
MKVFMGVDFASNLNPPDIQISMGLHTMYITIIISEHFGNISTIIILTMEGRGSGGHDHDRFDCLIWLIGSK